MPHACDTLRTYMQNSIDYHRTMSPLASELRSTHRYPRIPDRRSQGPSFSHSSGCQENCTLRNTRSGCGIRMVKRPSLLVRLVIPCGAHWGWRDKLPLHGRDYRHTASKRPASSTCCAPFSLANSARPSPCATTIGMREPAISRKNSDVTAALCSNPD